MRSNSLHAAELFVDQAIEWLGRYEGPAELFSMARWLSLKLDEVSFELRLPVQWMVADTDDGIELLYRPYGVVEAARVTLLRRY